MQTNPGGAVPPPTPLRPPFHDGGAMTEPTEHDEQEPTEPSVSDVPEPDQDADDEHEEAAEAEDQTPPDQPPETPEDQGAQQAEWEARFTKSERAFATYTRKVTEIYGDDAVSLTPFAISPSAPPGFIYGPDAGRVPEEIQRATFEFFGIAREKDYKPDPLTRTCTTCDGEGKTTTGSKVASFATRACPDCGGRGATGLDNAQPAPKANGHKDEPFTLTTSGPLEAADVDNWGEPRFLPDGSVNENFGRQPQYKVEHPVYGRTAGLTVQDAVS